MNEKKKKNSIEKKVINEHVSNEQDFKQQNYLIDGNWQSIYQVHPYHR